MTAVTPETPAVPDTLTMNTRNAYSVEQLRAVLAVAMVRYNRATTCSEAREYLNAQHSLRDRIAHAEFMARVFK